jgi:RNA polymerase sigma-70 factor (ECF subfamily)
MAKDRPTVDVAQLVAEHHQAVYRYAYRLTGSIQDAEDLAQQVFLVAQRKLGQLRKLDSARKWLFVILRHCFLRDRQRRRPVLAVDLRLNIDSVPADPPGEEIDRDRLQRALNELPEAFRLVLVMFYFEDCSYREMAERLDVPIGTVMSRLARAKGRFRAILFEAERPARVRRSEDELHGRKLDPQRANH